MRQNSRFARSSGLVLGLAHWGRGYFLEGQHRVWSRQKQGGRRSRHRLERRQSRRTEAGGEGLPRRRVRHRTSPARQHRRRRDYRRRRGRRRHPPPVRQQDVQDQGSRGIALGQRRHRQEDQPAADDGGRARRVDLLGGRAVHPVRHPGCEPRLPDPRSRHRRRMARARWTSCWWRRRRKRSPTTPTSSPRPAACRSWSTSTPSRCRTPTRSTTGRSRAPSSCC